MAGLLISEADAKRLRRVLQWFERQERGGGPSPGGGARPGFWIESWIGLVAAQGPNGEEDYTDERYWVERARCANTAGGEEGELALEALDEADPLAKCVTATDLAEIADGTHALGVGSAVAVFAAYDQQTPPLKHYWFGGGAGEPVGVTYFKPTEDWTTRKDYYVNASHCDHAGTVIETGWKLIVVPRVEVLPTVPPSPVWANVISGKVYRGLVVGDEGAKLAAILNVPLPKSDGTLYVYWSWDANGFLLADRVRGYE